MNGWPELRRSVPEDVRPHWNMRDEMSTSDGLLFARIVIPQSMRQDMLHILHGYGENKVTSTNCDILAGNVQSDRRHSSEVQHVPTL